MVVGISTFGRTAVHTHNREQPTASSNDNDNEYKDRHTDRQTRGQKDHMANFFQRFANNAAAAGDEHDDNMAINLALVGTSATLKTI